MSEGTAILLKCEMELAEAGDICHSTQALIASPERFVIEFDGPDPTIFALQTAISTWRSLQNAGRFSGFGPLAAKRLSSMTTSDHSSAGAT
jgi:hypothetical protein